MSILKKFKLWWKSTTSVEKVCIILSGISTAAAVTGAVCSVKTRHCMEDVKIDVKLYPGGKDDPNPVNLTPEDDAVDYTKPVPSPADDGRYDPYDLSKDVWEALNRSARVRDENGDVPKDMRLYMVNADAWDEAQEKTLQLAWDLAARENKLEQAEKEIPEQLHG